MMNDFSMFTMASDIRGWMEHNFPDISLIVEGKPWKKNHNQEK